MSNDPNIIISSPQFKPEDITYNALSNLSKDSFPLWCLSSDVRVDGHKVDFDSHRYLLPIYMDNSKEIVWQKAAQLGATIYLLLRVIWWLDNHDGRKAGLYFPTREGVDNLSKDRLTPLLKSCPAIATKIDLNDKLGLRTLGNSSFYLMHLEGKASKDSTPLDFITFDEVRLCSPASIDQALERISHSPHKFKMFMSTCGLPDTDINYRFNMGTQHTWMSKCGCEDGCDLSRAFPDCVVDTKKELYLRCPKCKYVIKDPQNGRYVAKNPGADYNSYQVSQLVSKFITLKDIWLAYQRTTNMEEFYNAKLGIPFIDEENRGITLSQLKGCIDESVYWGKQEQESFAMGIDQGAGYCMVTIASVRGDGKRCLRHIEVIENTNPEYFVNGKRVSPFVRVRELMREYNVALCVVDAMPNTNDALTFAQEFPGKVFLAWYQRDAKDVVQWGDKPKSKATIKKAGSFLKFKYTVVLARYLSLNVMLGSWADGKWVCPNPNKLVQMCRDEKTFQIQPEETCWRLFDHMCRLIKRFKVTNDETGEGRHEWIYSGTQDPHLAHSMNYLNVAVERLGKKPFFAFI